MIDEIDNDLNITQVQLDGNANNSQFTLRNTIEFKNNERILNTIKQYDQLRKDAYDDAIKILEEEEILKEKSNH